MDINKLSISRIAKLETRERTYLVADGLGLCLQVHSEGGRYWRYRYRFYGRARQVSCGTYPGTSISAARAKRDEYRAMVAGGLDPVSERQSEKESQLGSTVEAFAREWIETKLAEKTPKTRAQAISRLQNYVFPKIGTYPIGVIRPQMIVSLLENIERAGLGETAHRVRSLLDRIFRGAVVKGAISTNPVPQAQDLLNRVVTKGYAAITDAKPFQQLMADIRNYRGNRVVKYALEFLALTAARPGELRGARWDEIDFENEQWIIPAERMKMKLDHIVPLSNQALDILRILRAMSKGRTIGNWTGQDQMRIPTRGLKDFGGFIFSINGKSAISDGTLNKALRTLGYDRSRHVPHGFRKSFSTILHESGP